MLIKEGTAEEINDWFITSKTDEIVLCIFLGTSNSNTLLIPSLIEKSTRVDGIIGKKIGFLLCSQESTTSSYIDHDLATYNGSGESLSANSARKFLLQFDTIDLKSDSPKQRSKHAIEALAACTARMVPDFMQLYGIEHRELPCIITIVKGIDTVNISRLPLYCLWIPLRAGF